MGKYEEFIAAMQQKYMGSMSGGSGIDGVSVHAVAPAHLRNTNTGTGTLPQKQGNGMRYTGRGAPDEPAGIVDKDEMVVESDMIQKMGGPGNMREGVELLAEMKEKGMDMGKLKEMKETGAARSFQTGTGRNTAGQAAADARAAAETARMTAQAVARKTGTSAPNAMTTPAAPEVTTADQATSGMLDRESSRFAGRTDTAMNQIEDLAKGGSKAMEAVTETATRGLAGQQAVRSSALDQQLAQGGVEGGAARVAQAMERRQAGTEQSKLRSDLAIENQNRMERASTTMAQLGLQGENAEEMKHQFDVGVQKWGKEFEESGKRFGAEYAMNAAKFDYSKARDTINDFLNAGDFEGAAGAYKNLGIDINMDQLKNEQTRTNLANIMTDYNSFSTQFGADSPQATGELEKLYKLQNPNAAIDPKTGAITDKGYGDWLKQTKENAAIAASPIRAHLESIGEQGIDDMAASWGFDDINDFEFNGVKGASGMKNAITALANTGGLSFTEDGFTMDPDNPLLKSFMKGNEDGDTPKITLPDKFKTDPIIKDAPKGAGFIEGTYGNAFVGKDGTVTDITVRGVPDPGNRAAVSGSGSGFGISNGDGTWTLLSEGETVYFDKSGDWGGKSIPKGAYIREGDNLKNIETGNIYNITGENDSNAPGNTKWVSKDGTPQTRIPKPGDVNEKGQTYTKTKGGGYWK